MPSTRQLGFRVAEEGVRGPAQHLRGLEIHAQQTRKRQVDLLDFRERHAR